MVLSILLFLFSVVVAQQQTSLLRSPGGPSESALWISPITYSHALDGPAGGPMSYWYATQWSGQSQLNASAWSRGGGGLCPSTDKGYSTLWHITVPGAALCMQQNQLTKAFALLTVQDGSAVSSPTGGLPCGLEYDLFLSPTDDAYDNVPRTNLNASVPTSVPSLAEMAALTVRWNMTVEALNLSSPRCGAAGQCGPSGQVDFAYLVLGVVLGNVAEGQTLFYQVILHDTRAVVSTSCPGQDPCTKQAGNWFQTSLPALGYSDPIGSYPAAQGSCPGIGPDAAPVAYNLQILPSLTAALSTGAVKYGLDGAAEHWRVTGLYVGSGMQGNAVAHVRTEGLDITYESTA